MELTQAKLERGSGDMERVTRHGADAQLTHSQKEHDEEIRKVFDEIERTSHSMNTNMYGISLSKSEWQALKEKHVGKEG